VSRLTAAVPSLAAVVGVVAGAVVGLGVRSHRPVYHDAFAASAAGTLLYVVILGVGTVAGVYSMPAGEPGVGPSAAAAFSEPLVFFPVFVVETLVVATLVKRLRIWIVGDDTVAFS